MVVDCEALARVSDYERMQEVENADLQLQRELCRDLHHQWDLTDC